MPDAVATHPYLAGRGHPRVLAHRGLVTPEMAAQGVVENSDAAIAAAVAVGADCIETDCHLTCDGRVVLAHDADLVRLVGDPRAVADVDHAELARLLADRGGLLTLEEAFDRYPSARFNIDIKADAAVAAVGAIVGRDERARRALLTSFSDRRSARARRIADAAGERPAAAPGRTGIVRALAAASVLPVGLARRVFAPYTAMQIPEREAGVRVLTPRFVAAAHAAGTEVHVWTVNEPVRMLEFVALGVDGIVTDRADVALDTLGPLR